MNKKFIVLALVIVAGAGAFAWRELYPPIYPLRVTLVEQGIKKIRYDPADPNSTIGVLHAEDNVAQVAGHEVEPGEFLWEIKGARVRTHPQGQWQDVPPAPFNKVASWPVVYEMKMDLPYSMVGRFVDRPGEWQISVRHTRTYKSSRGLWRGSAEHTLRHVMPKLPPPPDTSFVPGKAYIAGLQVNSDNHWREIPQAGRPGFPLTLTAQGMADLRAVQTNPKESWPDWKEGEEPWPRWKGTGVEALSVGDAMRDLNNPALTARHARDFKTITVTCGNTITRQVLVLSKPDVIMHMPTAVLSRAKNKKTITLQIEAKVDWTSGWHPPIKVRFSAHEVPRPDNPNSAPGKAIGQINGPSPKDDIVSLKGDAGTAKATLTLPDKPKVIQLKAMLVIPNNTSESHRTRFNVAELRR
jgi:hypothetical protein